MTPPPFDVLCAFGGLAPIAFVAGLIVGSKYPWPTPFLGRNRRHGRNPH